MLNLPPIPGAPAGRVRQGGLDTLTRAEQMLDDVRRLIALADVADDPASARTAMVGLINEALKAKRPLPSYDEVRRKVLVGQPLNDAMTVAQWLTEWFASRVDLRKTTRRSYESHIRLYLIPHLGHIRLDRLRTTQVQTMFAAIDEHNEVIVANNAARRLLEQTARRSWKEGDRAGARAARARLAELEPFRRPVNASAKQSIRATLRSALTDAVAQQLVQVNVAKLVKLAPGKRPRPVVWSPERVAQWRKTGTRPSSVMIWDAGCTAAFLQRARRHEALYALFHLVAFTGLRRGEACGLRWADVELAKSTMAVREQIVQLGWATESGQPKTDAGERVVALDPATVAVLAAHRRRQITARIRHGQGWIDSGLVFTADDGGPLHPAWVTEQFKLLTREADLPPIRLHDLRHGAATHALSAGIDVKVVQDMLGHSSSTITRDTYTSVVDEVKHNAAAAVARVFLAAGLQQPAPDRRRYSQPADSPATRSRHTDPSRTQERP